VAEAAAGCRAAGSLPMMQTLSSGGTAILSGTGKEDVLRAVARGLTNAEIAAELFVTLSTVKTHPAAIHAKLGARNRVEVAAWAHRSGRMDGG
jgi:DNA-binding NarL/FixJ family response regulator